VVGLGSHPCSGKPFEHSRITTAITDAIDLARPHSSDGSVDLIPRTGLPDYRAVIVAGAEYLGRDILWHAAQEAAIGFDIEVALITDGRVRS
jgi:hypothetical protein